MTFGDCRCACGEADIFAIAPGNDADRRGAVDLFTRDDPIVTISTKDTGWCRACWIRQFTRLAQ